MGKDPYVQIIKACLPKKGLRVKRRGGLVQKNSPWDSFYSAPAHSGGLPPA
jgi:hypothetical protein